MSFWAICDGYEKMSSYIGKSSQKFVKMHKVLL